MAETVKTAADAEMAEAPEVNGTTPTPGHGENPEQQEQPSEQPNTEGLEQNEPVLPAAFPKKRRGRPPGRPNMTVRETDYEDNALVQNWNAAKGDRAIPVIPIGIRVALTEQSLIHETQKAVFRLPSRETIYFVQGWITARHIASQRPSYVNGLLIHSRGQDAPVACTQCVERRAKHALGPFLTCRVLPGSYHNSCSNCKWFDNTSVCSLYTGPKPNRKRKAKEQLPPPPHDGVSPPAGQPLHQQEQHDLQHQYQPAPNMTPIQGNDEGPYPEHALNQSAHSRSHTEISGSELAEAPSQPDSLADSHFLLPKSNGSVEGAHESGHDDE